MLSKQDLRNVIDIIPEEQVQSLYDYAMFLISSNDDILTAEDKKIIAENNKDLEKGIYYTLDDI